LSGAGGDPRTGKFAAPVALLPCSTITPPRTPAPTKKLMATVGHGDVVVIAAGDRLSRDTTDLMVIARDLQKAGASLRSLAEPVVDTTSDFAELVLAMLGVIHRSRL
jgi:Resolvase, N terminal domain